MVCLVDQEDAGQGGFPADECAPSCADACDRAFDELAEQLQLPPLALRSHLDAKHSEMALWRDLAKRLSKELEQLTPP